jgi:hypothetical protein
LVQENEGGDLKGSSAKNRVYGEEFIEMTRISQRELGVDEVKNPVSCVYGWA